MLEGFLKVLKEAALIIWCIRHLFVKEDIFLGKREISSLAGKMNV
jgi:hypothetical protein